MALPPAISATTDAIRELLDRAALGSPDLAGLPTGTAAESAVDAGRDAEVLGAPALQLGS